MRNPSKAERTFILDHRSGETGTIEDWVTRFSQVWSDPRDRLEDLLALLDDAVHLQAPSRPPESRGKEAARAAFQRAFVGMPDLHADIGQWSASGDSLFIAMTFRASIGGRALAWKNVDQFQFANGSAVQRTAHFDPTPVRRAFTRNWAGLRALLAMRIHGK